MRALRTGFIEIGTIGTIGRIGRIGNLGKSITNLLKFIKFIKFTKLLIIYHLNQQDKFLVRSHEMRLITRNKFLVRRG